MNPRVPQAPLPAPRPGSPIRRRPIRRPPAPEPDTLQLDYQTTNDQIKLLTDIRFRLLAFLPPLVGVASAILSVGLGQAALPPMLIMSVAVFGFFATLGVILYDLRNSQLYNAHVHRAMLIERALEMRSHSAFAANSHAGPHTLRMWSDDRFLGFGVNHGAALSLVYAAILAAWVYPASRGLFILLGTHIASGRGYTTSFLALLAAAFSGWWLYKRLDTVDKSNPLYDRLRSVKWRLYAWLRNVDAPERRPYKWLHAINSRSAEFRLVPALILTSGVYLVFRCALGFLPPAKWFGFVTEPATKLLPEYGSGRGNTTSLLALLLAASVGWYLYKRLGAADVPGLAEAGVYDDANEARTNVRETRLALLHRIEEGKGKINRKELEVYGLDRLIDTMKSAGLIDVDNSSKEVSLTNRGRRLYEKQLDAHKKALRGERLEGREKLLDSLRRDLNPAASKTGT